MRGTPVPPVLRLPLLLGAPVSGASGEGQRWDPSPRSCAGGVGLAAMGPPPPHPRCSPHPTSHPALAEGLTRGRGACPLCCYFLTRGHFTRRWHTGAGILPEKVGGARRLGLWPWPWRPSLPLMEDISVLSVEPRPHLPPSAPVISPSAGQAEERAREGVTRPLILPISRCCPPALPSPVHDPV